MNESRTTSHLVARLAVTIVAAGFLAAGLLTLRHRRLELMNEMTRLHGGMDGLHHELWDLQIHLSKDTGPTALNQMAKQAHGDGAGDGWAGSRPGL